MLLLCFCSTMSLTDWGGEEEREERWKGGRMEGWKGGRVEGWKRGGWKEKSRRGNCRKGGCRRDECRKEGKIVGKYRMDGKGVNKRGNSKGSENCRM